MELVKSTLKKNTMIVALVVVTLLFTILTNGKILNPQNVTNIIIQNAYVIILAVGMLLCILTGGNIDLSVGSVVCLVGAIAGTFIVNMGMNIYLAMLLCLGIGILIGAWQGFWIAYVKIPPFIVTLAGMLLWRGAALIVLGGLTISPFPDNYLSIFNDYLGDPFDLSINMVAVIIGVITCVFFIFMQIRSRAIKVKKGYETESNKAMIARIVAVSVVIIFATYMLANYKGVPNILILLAIIVAVYAYFTSRTVPGRHLYAYGGNEKATRLSGINTNRVMFMAYTNMGFLAAVAALVCVARFNSAAPTAGQNYEMDAISSCFIGGASAYGGVGKVSGAVIGAVLMGVINNGMSIMSVDSNYQKVVKGLVLLAAVAFDVISKRKSQVN